MAAFEPVEPKVSFPELERGILAFWKEADIFRKSLEARQDAPLWVFYEGPPTANGIPGVHHVEPRTFKDVYPRFKSMTGYRVPRKAGWDCHGLPVELEVEKEIGTTGKRDIEAFGVAEFNRLCRESVTRYVDEFERLTERIGFWIDMSDAYWTMSTDYIESVWWSLKQLHARGLLVEADKVNAYCPRCGTALSDAEVALGYRPVEDPSVFVKFPLVEVPRDPSLAGACLVVWTTTPWTLPSNEGAAVALNAEYAVVEVNGERLVMASDLRERVLGGDGAVVARVPGETLVDARYTPPYPNVEDAHRVVSAGFVSTDDGTGVVHIAPAFGPEDLEIGLREGWPVYKPVDDAGRFTHPAPEFIHGRAVKDADPHIIENLQARGVLLKTEVYEHAYPFCWRCATPLLYMARKSWYVRTTAVKQRLLDVNGTVAWFPEHIKGGRYGNWLENNVDWAISRERYWGTPLPIWRCSAAHETAVGSLAELGELTARDVAGVDPHRPAIDDITFACPDCGLTSTRVPEVIDAWYDSGAMPFAQWGYHPELGRGLDEFAQHFPADFISEAIDQTRGWFYTLMAEGVLLFDTTAYRNVVCLGHIIAADGRKMSKSLGNMFDPWGALDRQGADALRWFMVTNGSPWASRRISHEALDEVLRQFLLTLWNVYSFYVTYANADSFDPTAAEPKRSDRPLMDRWVLSRLERTVATARGGLETYDATGAGRAIQSFVDDLSNWYVRRSRRRFWDPGGGGGGDSAAAFHTLHECLVTVATMLAPFTPFLAEALWRNLAAGRADQPESVHLADYPTPAHELIDDALEETMAVARAISVLGRTIRVETKTKVRQPLSEAVVHYSGDHAALSPLLDLVADELNVKEIVFAGSAGDFGRWHAKPDYRILGPRLGPTVKDVADVLAGDDGTLAGALAHGELVVLSTSLGQIELQPGDVDLTQEVRQGWGVASDGGLTVALDLELTPELRKEGRARELVRVVQDARKAAGLDVSDRVDLGIQASGEIADSLAVHRDLVAGETLAVTIGDDLLPDGFRQDADIDGTPVLITVRKSTTNAARPH
jgi:isoleucyl-tRNA synthetase